MNIQINENSETENYNNKQVCQAYLMSVTFSCSGQEYSMQENCHWIHTYRIDCISGGSGPGGSTGGLGDSPKEPESIPSVPTESDPDYDTGSGGGNYSPPSFVTLKVDRSVDFKNNLKINCTYNQLLKGSSLATILKDFLAEDLDFNVTFNIVDNLVCNDKPNATGCTTPLGGNNYRVDIDKAYINDPNTPTIFLAQTLIHESIHAKLFAAVKKLQNGIAPTDTIFEELYNSYKHLKGWSHEIMAKRYTDMMQAALKEVHPMLNDNSFLNGYSDNTLWGWDKFYEYVSYRGLKNTESGGQYFNNLNSNISLYLQGAEANSTKTPNCN